LDIVHAESPNHAARPAGVKPDMIVLHATASGLTSALNWLRNPQRDNPSRRVSSHDLIAKNGTVYVLVDDAREAWHAGASFWRGRSNINRFSIGVEIVNLNNGKDPYPEAQYESTLQRVVQRCKVWTIEPTRDTVVAHYDISPGRKTDPVSFPIDQFVQDVRHTLNLTTSGIVDGNTIDAYYVVPQKANIRQAPYTVWPTDSDKAGETVAIAGQLERGHMVYIDAVVTGEHVLGSDQWMHMAHVTDLQGKTVQYDAGFIHSKLLRK
jgi:N-acetyl-anhydromuramyl-L-alanine amidase AmpD